MGKAEKPHWWQLYILGLVVIGFIIWAQTWHISDALRGTINIGVVLCAYGVLNMWFGLNNVALEQERERREALAAGHEAPMTQRQAAFRRAIDQRKGIKKS